MVFVCFLTIFKIFSRVLTLTDTGEGSSLSSWALFYFHKTYFCKLWPMQRVMRYEPFVEERCNISRIVDTYKKSFICILAKHRYIPHTDNLLLIPDLFVRPMKMCLWRHNWLHDVLWRLNKQKKINHIR